MVHMSDWYISFCSQYGTSKWYRNVPRALKKSVCILKLKAKSLVYEIFPYMNFVFYLGDGNTSLESLWVEYITINVLW